MCVANGVDKAGVANGGQMIDLYATMGCGWERWMVGITDYKNMGWALLSDIMTRFKGCQRYMWETQ